MILCLPHLKYWGLTAGQPSVFLRTHRLFFSLLLRFDLGFHGFYQLGELFLAFFTCLGVDILGYAFTVDSRREPSFVEVVVYHSDASRAALAYLPLVGLKFLLRRGFRGGGFTCLGWLHALREFGHFCVCTANLSVCFDRLLLSHIVGETRINVMSGFFDCMSVILTMQAYWGIIKAS